MGTFKEKLEANFAAGKYVCAGLDPVFDRIPPTLKGTHAEVLAFYEKCVAVNKNPEYLRRQLWQVYDAEVETIRQFLYPLVTKAAPHVAAYKPNWSFFVHYGRMGLQLLEDLCGMIKQNAPQALLIIDMKVGDIDTSNNGYVNFAYEICGADAITVHPYMGSQAMQPFLKDPNRGVFVLCRTSNKGSDELQGADVHGSPLFLRTADAVRLAWDTNQNCGLVAGATHPKELGMIRERSNLPLLVPGIGAQGGSLTQILAAAYNLDWPDAPFLINLSRSFMHASSGGDFAEAGETELKRTNDQIRECMTILAEEAQKRSVRNQGG